MQYYLSPKIALQKKLKACDKGIVNIQVKSKNNVVIQLNTATYQLLIQKLTPLLLKQQNKKIEIAQSMDAAKSITQDTIKVFKNPNIQRRSKCFYTINCYRTTSNILINGTYIDNFLSNEMKTVIDILEQNKIHIQSTNSPLKKILSNTVTNNPATTINNTDSINGKHTPEGKKMDDSTKETEENNNFFDPKEKEIANKTQLQNKENEFHTDVLNLNENATSDPLSSCSQCKKDDNGFMIECSECKAWIYYQCTELPLYMISSLVKGTTKYSCSSCINMNETLEKYTKSLKTYKPGENEPSSTIPEKEIENLQHLLSEKETEIQKLDDSKTVNENKIAHMKHEIENLKNEKQILLNLIKLKKQEIYEKNQTIEQYEKENSNHKLALKKQETLIKATTEKGNKLQNELDQTKTEMAIQQKELSELIQNL